MQKPHIKPARPYFSSGPCAKPPGWTLEWLKDAALGRSHRSGLGKGKLKEIIDRHRALLNIPADYRIAITPASDTGAFEMCLWSMLGPKPVDVIAFESFGFVWTTDILKQLKIQSARDIRAGYGELPDLKQADALNNDIVFTWNGTSGGARVPDGNWIPSDRMGLTFCDATSAVFAYDLPWDKLDVTTWSWQKCLGSEAAHGMLVLSPRAVERLETFKTTHALPKLFRMTKDGKIAEGIFVGETINTPSMLAVEDCLACLKWVEQSGGLTAMLDRTEKNYKALEGVVNAASWMEFLAKDESVRSKTSVCVAITDPGFCALDETAQNAFVKKMTGLLDKEGVAYDIAGYRDAPPSLRIWCGPTIEADDIAALGPWLDWAFAETAAQLKEAA